jgi:hypothetical protein
MEDNNKSKYPCYCNCCEEPVYLQNRFISSKHKNKLSKLEMARTNEKAINELNSQVRILIPKIINNNYDANCIRESIIDFFNSDGFDELKPEIQAEVNKRLNKIDEAIEAKVEKTDEVIKNPCLSIKHQEELYALPEKLRSRKFSVSTDTNSSFDTPLPEYKYNSEDLNEELSYLKARIAVVEYEKFRRDNYAHQIVYQNLKRKFDEVATAKKSKISFSSSQEVKMET